MKHDQLVQECREVFRRHIYVASELICTCGVEGLKQDEYWDHLAERVWQEVLLP